LSLEILKNRLSQPIPEKCPLSEALVWMVTECLPISLEDSKTINTPNLTYTGSNQTVYVMDQSVDDDFPESEYYAYDSYGKKVPVDSDALSSGKNNLLIALKNGQITAWGDYGDIDVDCPEEDTPSSFKLRYAWNTYYKKNYADVLFDDANKEIPSELWSWELIDWLANILHHPLRQEKLSQFSDVVISTEELFKEFAKPEFLQRLHPVERFLIPVSEAASLMTTGEHNSDNSAIQGILAQKSAELLRALRNGKLYSEGLSFDGDVRPIERIFWSNRPDVSNNKTAHFSLAVVDENAIRALFDIPETEMPPTENTVPLSKRGRPPLVGKEAWLTELAVLFKSGLITQSDNLEVIAQALIDALKDNHNKTISLDTVRKDWLRPIFKEAKKRNGDK
jgi:hypothetical protein